MFETLTTALTDTSKHFAYVRVSMKEQNEDRQLIALEPYGIVCRKRQITDSMQQRT